MFGVHFKTVIYHSIMNHVIKRFPLHEGINGIKDKSEASGQIAWIHWLIWSFTVHIGKG